MQSLTTVHQAFFLFLIKNYKLLSLMIMKRWQVYDWNFQASLSQVVLINTTLSLTIDYSGTQKWNYFFCHRHFLLQQLQVFIESFDFIGHIPHCFTKLWNKNNQLVFLRDLSPLDTRGKWKVHKMFRICPAHFLNFFIYAQFTPCLQGV